MNPDSEEINLYCLGPYTPADASRIFAAFEKAGIEFRTEFATDEPSVEMEGDSPETEVFIVVALPQHKAACEVLAELFGGESLDENLV